LPGNVSVSWSREVTAPEREQSIPFWWRDPVEHCRLRAKYGSSQKAATRVEPSISTRNAQQWWRKLRDAGYVDASGRPTGAHAAVDTSLQGRPSRSSPDGTSPGEQVKAWKDGSRLEIYTAVSETGTGELTGEDVLRRKGYDPAEWDFTLESTDWDAVLGRDPVTGEPVVTTLSRTKVVAVRRPESFFAFELPIGWKPEPAKPSERDWSKPLLIPILADPHAPNCQVELIEAFLAWCEAYRPEAVWCLGDAANNSPFGRHGHNRRADLNVSTSDAVGSTTELLIRIAAATPGAKRTLLFGNHDYWLERMVLALFPRLAEMRLHGEEKPHLAISTVLKLDQIGWDYHYTEGDYHDVDVEIVPGLVGMHGTRTGKHGGALKELERWEGVSIIQGHDHTLGMTAVRYRLPNRRYQQRYGISAGSAANADLGYDPGHNVGQGFPVLALWPDGRWHVDFALYDPATGSTTWRDFRYDAR
jgi:hypothetical protein